MRRVIVFVVMMGCTAAAASASQARGSAAAGKKVSACSLLTADLMEKFDTARPETRKQFPPEEEAIGTNGTYCGYGGVILQVNPFVRSADLRKSPGKDWQSVAGLGDTAFFRNNGDRHAELMVWIGPHHFTIQLDVPDGASVESIRPKAMGLANAIILKLR